MGYSDGCSVGAIETDSPKRLGHHFLSVLPVDERLRMYVCLTTDTLVVMR